MLNQLYRYAVRQPRWVKDVIVLLGRTGISALSVLKGFKPAEQLSVMSYEMLLGTWDAGVSALLKRVLRPGMTVVDVGAHVGYFALEASKLVESAGRVHAFEPNKENREKLLYNTGRLANVVCHGQAISDRVGTITFYDSNNGTGSNSIIASRSGHKGEHAVETTTIDEFLKGAPVDLIKIDVEGAEHLVLAGMTETARQVDLHLIVEFYPALFTKQGLPGHVVLDKLHELGFSVHALDDGSGEISDSIEPSSFKSYAATLPVKYVNLYAKKRS